MPYVIGGDPRPFMGQAPAPSIRLILGLKKEILLLEHKLPSSSELGEKLSCRVCRHPTASSGITEAGRRFQSCSRCGARAIDPEEVADPSTRDDPELIPNAGKPNRRARAETEALLSPLIATLPEGSYGLNFRCGSWPMGTMCLREAGFKCQDYDPLHAPFSAALDRVYDFVVAIDVADQFPDPASELDLLEDLIRPGGWLLLTHRNSVQGSPAALIVDDDPLVVAAYEPRTLRCIGTDRRWTLALQDDKRTLFRMLINDASQ
jgi:hypothetical protein